jgi:hypothetical protein
MSKTCDEVVREIVSDLSDKELAEKIGQTIHCPQGVIKLWPIEYGYFMEAVRRLEKPRIKEGDGNKCSGKV